MKGKGWMILTGLMVVGLALAYGPRAGIGGAAGMGAPRLGLTAGFAGTLHEKVAALLGVTPEELIALHQAGKTLSQIAQELGVDPAKFEAQLVEIRNAAIDGAVKADSLTEAQAALMKTRTQAALRAMLQREIGPASGFAYGPAQGVQAYGRHAGQPVAPRVPQEGGKGPFGPSSPLPSQEAARQGGGAKYSAGVWIQAPTQAVGGGEDLCLDGAKPTVGEGLRVPS